MIVYMLLHVGVNFMRPCPANSVLVINRAIFYDGDDDISVCDGAGGDVIIMVMVTLMSVKILTDYHRDHNTYLSLKVLIREHATNI